jgi:hypothetical protein
MSKHGKNQRWFAPNDGEKYFNQYQQKFGGKPFRVRMVKGLEETHKFEGKKSNKSEVEENIFKKMFGKKEDPEVAREKDRKENPSLWDAGYEYVNDIVGWQVPEPGQSRFNRDQKDMKDEEMEEGNAFSGARAQAIEDGEDTFEVDGKTYHVKGEKKMNESEDKFIQKANMTKGGLHKALGIPEGKKIPKAKLNAIKKDLMTKAKGDKKLSAADSKLLKQVNMALTLGGLNESRNTLSLSENELIDMIEKIVLQEQSKSDDVKDFLYNLINNDTQLQKAT